MRQLREHLRRYLSGRVCIIALGNCEYGDDGFGVRLGEQLQQAGMRNVVLAGTTPDRCIGRVVEQHFEQVLFLDAVEFAAAPGSVILLDGLEICSRYPQISTHKISLGVLARWIEAGERTKVWLLGVQPESMKVGHGLTATMQRSLEVLRELLLGLDIDREPAGVQATASEVRSENVIV